MLFHDYVEKKQGEVSEEYKRSNGISRAKDLNPRSYLSSGVGQNIAPKPFCSDYILASRIDATPPLIIKYCVLYPEDILELFSLYDFLPLSPLSLTDCVLTSGILRE